jgi:hypothetical protein
MSLARLKFPELPTDRDLLRMWAKAAWIDIGAPESQCWLPTNPSVIAGDPVENWRVAVVEIAAQTNMFAIVLDGTTCRRRNGLPQAWHDLHGAGFDALHMLKESWHGPALRFRPSQPWHLREGTPTRLLLSGDVAIIRKWRLPYSTDRWGVFREGRRSLVLQTNPWDMVEQFATPEAAQLAADNEVGCWARAAEL